MRGDAMRQLAPEVPAPDIHTRSRPGTHFTGCARNVSVVATRDEKCNPDDDDALYPPKRRVVHADAAELHEWCSDAGDVPEAVGGEAQGQLEGFGQGPCEGVQAWCEGDLCEEVDEVVSGGEVRAEEAGSVSTGRNVGTHGRCWTVGLVFCRGPDTAEEQEGDSDTSIIYKLTVEHGDPSLTGYDAAHKVVTYYQPAAQALRSGR